MNQIFPIRSSITWLNIDGSHSRLAPNEFENVVRKFATILARHPNRELCIFWEPSTAAMAIFLGALLAGKCPAFFSVPNAKLSGDYFAHQLSSLKQQKLYTVGSDRFSHLQLDLIIRDRDIYEAKPSGATLSEGSTAKFMQFSSGTTGTRKRVGYAVNDLLRHNYEYAKALELGEDETVATWLPLYHDMGLIAAFLLPLQFGFDLVAMSNVNWVARPQLFVDACVSLQPTLCWQPNFAYSFAVDRCTAADLSTTRFVSCAEPVFETASRSFEDKFQTSVYGCYAMAENIFAVTQSKSKNAVRGVRSSGLPVGNTAIRIENDEILVKSEFLFSHYETGEQNSTDNGWYHTGDLGFIDHGELFVLGRIDDSFKVRGIKIIPEQVEHALNAIPGVVPGRCVCFAEQRSATCESVVLYEGTAPERDVWLTLQAIGITKVKKVPDRWLVKSSSGKISRRACAKKLLQESS